MSNSARRRGLLLPLIAITATLVGTGISLAQTNDGTDLSIELVDPKVLRVCADPRNLRNGPSSSSVMAEASKKFFGGASVRCAVR